MLAAWRVNAIEATRAKHAAELAAAAQRHRETKRGFIEEKEESNEQFFELNRLIKENEKIKQHLASVGDTLQRETACRQVIENLKDQVSMLNEENCTLRAEATDWAQSEAKHASGLTARGAELEAMKQDLLMVSMEHEVISTRYEEQAILISSMEEKHEISKGDLVRKLKCEFANSLKMGNEIMALREALEASGEFAAAAVSAKRIRDEVEELHLETAHRMGRKLDLEAALVDLEAATRERETLHKERDSVKREGGLRLLREVCYRWAQRSIGACLSTWGLSAREAALTLQLATARAAEINVASQGLLSKYTASRETIGLLKGELVEKAERMERFMEEQVVEAGLAQEQVSRARLEAEKEASLQVIKRVIARLFLGGCAERIQNFRLNMLDGLLTARVRVVKRRAESTHRSSAMSMFQRAWKRIQLGLVGQNFFEWKLNQHRMAVMRAGSGARSKHLARVVREGGMMMLRHTMHHWLSNSVGRMVHTWQEAMLHWRCETRHADQVMYLAEENDGLACELQEKSERLTELERLSAFFDEQGA